MSSALTWPKRDKIISEVTPYYTATIITYQPTKLDNFHEQSNHVQIITTYINGHSLTFSRKSTNALCCNSILITVTCPSKDAFINAVWPFYMANSGEIQLRNTSSMRRGNRKRSGPERVTARWTYFVLQIYLRIMFQQLFDHFWMTWLRCPHQRSHTILKIVNCIERYRRYSRTSKGTYTVLPVHLSSVGEQHINHWCLALICCLHQHRFTVLYSS